MKYLCSVLFFVLPAVAADGDVVFRSDVSLARVDVQVLDRDNRAITGLHKEDFELREGGQVREIRNFSAEEMPVDLLFLLDVSASMRPHVERIAAAARDALRLLGEEDRVAIMVFDQVARVRMSFRGDLAEVDREFKKLLNQETFQGGTEITLSLQSAAAYIRKNGRLNARRAIVILTDDQTGGMRNEEAVLRSLTNAQAVLSALIAPDAMPGLQGSPRSGRRGGGSSWPGSGGGPLGGIILGGPLGGGGGRYPGGGGGHTGGPRTHPAGTAEIARQSGGDSLPVDDASALEDTINRIRRRYALHFHVDEGVKAGQEGRVEVVLADNARRRSPDAEVRYRRVYVSADGVNDGGGADERPVITRLPRRMPGEIARPEVSQTAGREPTVTRRRPAVSERDGSYGGNPSVATAAAQEDTNASEVTTPAAPAAPAGPAAPGATAASKQGGWRVLQPGEKP